MRAGREVQVSVDPGGVEDQIRGLGCTGLDGPSGLLERLPVPRRDRLRLGPADEGHRGPRAGRPVAGQRLDRDGLRRDRELGREVPRQLDRREGRLLGRPFERERPRRDPLSVVSGRAVAAGRIVAPFATGRERGQPDQCSGFERPSRCVEAMHGANPERERTDSRKKRQAGCVWTIGHSNVAWADFLPLLRFHRIECVADVRRFPASRRHPHFDREPLRAALEVAGIGYRWLEDLGGRRGGLGRASPNLGIESAGFRGYADHMRTEPFRRAFEDLVEILSERRTAIMCAEALWWRCHRRLLSDLLVHRGVTVHHILPDGRTARHELWNLARPSPDGLTYPPVQSELEV